LLKIECENEWHMCKCTTYGTNAAKILLIFPTRLFFGCYGN
jgi:hypothetical protein